jgi:hypothetical protein
MKLVITLVCVLAILAMHGCTNGKTKDKSFTRENGLFTETINYVVAVNRDDYKLEKDALYISISSEFKFLDAEVEMRFDEISKTACGKEKMPVDISSEYTILGVFAALEEREVIRPKHQRDKLYECKKK